MRLNKIQSYMADILLDIPARLQEADAGIFRTGKIELPERLKVYRNNVMGNIGHALLANFPLSEKLVGREFLSGIARRYILAHPPVGGCLTFYGEDFGDFVEQQSEAQSLPYLADILRLEILINRSYHADDDVALAAEDMAGVELESFALKTRDSVQFMESQWPLPALRDFCLNGGEAPDIHAGGLCLMVYRAGLNVEIAEISQGEYAFLRNIQTKPLGQSVADSMAVYPDFDFQKTLPRFMNWQIFLNPEME